MKKILAILVLTLWFTTQSQADDIKDFQIEGMSIGDSLLDFYSEKEISEAIDESGDKKYTIKTIMANQSNLYENLQFAYKSSDQKKIIVGLGGVIYFRNNISNCKKEMKKISTELTNLFPNADKKEWGKYKFPGGKGHYFPITFTFADSTLAMVACNEFNKESGIDYNLKVTLFSAEYNQHLKKKNN